MERDREGRGGGRSLERATQQGVTCGEVLRLAFLSPSFSLNRRLCVCWLPAAHLEHLEPLHTQVCSAPPVSGTARLRHDGVLSSHSSKCEAMRYWLWSCLRGGVLVERRHTQVPHTLLLDNSTFESAVFFSSSMGVLSPLDLIPSMQGRHPLPCPPPPRR